MRIKYAKEAMVVLIVIVAVITLRQTFAPVVCGDDLCFQANLIKCNSAAYINEEDEASWRYEIKGTGDKACLVDVTLLAAKEGNIDLRAYEGISMLCRHPLKTGGYPEKNIALCHGELKEGLQDIVIEKLYKYIVANLGEIRREMLY